jgi:hypothetical protein
MNPTQGKIISESDNQKFPVASPITGTPLGVILFLSFF